MLTPSPSLQSPLADDQKLLRRLQLNYTRNQQQDQSDHLDQLVAQFNYQDCQHDYWNPEEFSLLYGTPLWDQASVHQRVILNQLYWVAYYTQIISAEIATILFNQTSAAGLFALEDFRLICDMLDLESTQERSHIYAFKTITTAVEQALFGERIFTYAMRGPFTETMIFADTNQLKTFWKKLQLHAFGLISADNPYLACQYFTVRGLRTLNGKLIQYKLSRYCPSDQAPIPSQISHYHYLDESFHFTSSTLIGQEVVRCLKPPTAWETWIANLGIRGCQLDHYYFSAAINGIFWFDPALVPAIFKVLRSPVFNLDDREAKQLIWACFAEETEGLHLSFATHREAVASYQAYLDQIGYLWPSNRDIAIMASNSIEITLKRHRRALAREWR